MATENPDRVVLHQFAGYPSSGVPSFSSFCVKLETFLRAAKIDFVNSFGLARSAKGKVRMRMYAWMHLCRSRRGCCACIGCRRSRFACLTK